MEVCQAMLEPGCNAEGVPSTMMECTSDCEKLNPSEGCEEERRDYFNCLASADWSCDGKDFPTNSGACNSGAGKYGSCIGA